MTATGSVQLTVQAAPVLTSVTVTPAGPSVTVGGTVQLTASAQDQYGNAFAANITWASSDSTKAIVNNTGLVTGVSAGAPQITATATGGGVTVPRSVTVTVTAVAPSGADVLATTSNTFAPATVDISVHQSVNWTFQTTHNVTFTGGSGAPSNIPDTGSGTVSRTFDAAGTFTYVCTLHGGMTGTVIVH